MSAEFHLTYWHPSLAFFLQRMTDQGIEMTPDIKKKIQEHLREDLQKGERDIRLLTKYLDEFDISDESATYHPEPKQKRIDESFFFYENYLKKIENELVKSN